MRNCPTWSKATKLFLTPFDEEGKSSIFGCSRDIWSSCKCLPFHSPGHASVAKRSAPSPTSNSHGLLSGCGATLIASVCRTVAVSRRSLSSAKRDTLLWLPRELRIPLYRIDQTARIVRFGAITAWYCPSWHSFRVYRKTLQTYGAAVGDLLIPRCWHELWGGRDKRRTKCLGRV